MLYLWMSYVHFYYMCDMLFTISVYDVTFMLGVGGQRWLCYS